MLGGLSLGTWLILLVDLIAIVIVVMFLRSRIQLKLKEVEARQAHERLMRKQARDEDPQPSEED
jgi:hypothetical protein